MSVVVISPDLVEINTLLLQPSQSFSSSSSGITGSIRLVAKPSQSIKTIPGSTSGVAFVETSGITRDDDFLYDASQSYKAGSTNIFQQISAYVDSVNRTSVGRKNTVQTYPLRIESPSKISAPEMDLQTGIVSFNTDPYEWQSFHKRVIKNFLIPDQVVENPSSFFSYVNYNCINFISSSNFPTASAIVFPNFPNATGIRDYTPDKEFTVDFFIKPHAPIDVTRKYHAGTILHISSSICVSLASGSSLGPDEKPDKFRIVLQLSHSADVRPSNLNLSSLPLSFPSDLAFATPAVLDRDVWNRVTIRWGASLRSAGTGSIRVNNSLTKFNANFQTISTGLASDALMVGNYYDSGDRIARFFNSTAASIYGTQTDTVPGTSDPIGMTLSNPLHAEIHHLSIFKRYVPDDEIASINDLYSLDDLEGGPSFFLPPFFTSSIPAAVVAPYTPTSTNELKTDDPIFHKMALGYNALYVNTQNFLMDFAKKKQSRAYGMSEFTEVSTPFDLRDGNVDSLIMQQPSVRRRNFTIFPCDDGNFVPDFSILDGDATRFHIVGNFTSSMLVSLEKLAPLSAYYPVTKFGDFEYDGSDSPYLPLLQDINFPIAVGDLADLSSNRIVIFTIPSIYYMNRIIPGTFVLTDNNLSGSGGISVTLRDDGRGNLYRSDCISPPATWNRVGSIFYSHGIVAILTPHLPFFGKTGFEMSFRGDMRRVVANFTVPASPGAINNSYNPTYQEFPPTELRSEQADEFTYISGINLHDQNFNVVMRAKLAQSIQKREGDELVFRLRYDF